MAEKQAGQFLLEVRRHRNNELQFTICERVQERANPDGRLERIVRIWGLPLHTVYPDVVEALRASGHLPSTIAKPTVGPLPLEEEAGLRLGLLFKAVKPLSKVERMEDIRDGIATMSREEVAYWFAKTQNAHGRRAEAALRKLLAGG